MKSSKQQLLAGIKQTILSVAPDGKVILYGSHARGDERADSDWDLLILLNKDKIESNDFDLISYPLYELGWNEGELFSPKLYTVNEWEKRSFTPFYKNVQNEGIIL
ncbi:MAG TPA: nucleotidyltransferase domain-containing protein [Paludibacter sp.]|nr:nucleotidyltransferase domain-containing protein [Paludibacter sp.]